MNILILANSHLDCNSGTHILSLARALEQLDVRCTVCVPTARDAELSRRLSDVEVTSFQELENRLSIMVIDLILAWTPREGNRKTLEYILKRRALPYFIHFEDNELHLARIAFNLQQRDIENWLDGGSDGFPVVPDHLSDPGKLKQLISNSSGVTVLVDELAGLINQTVPSVVFWPGYDESLLWGMDADNSYREFLGIKAGEFVVAYTGNVHTANVSEVRSLYLAIALLNRRGMPVRLIRTGDDFCALSDHGEELLKRHVIELGSVPRADLPRVLSVADVLVQPGSPDDFNIYRFPSKLPEFMASRRPVVLPHCNIGSYLQDGRDAVVLAKCGGIGIAKALEDLLPDSKRRSMIGHGGALFASRYLRWHIAAQRVAPFFLRQIGDSR